MQRHLSLCNDSYTPCLQIPPKNTVEGSPTLYMPLTPMCHAQEKHCFWGRHCTSSFAYFARNWVCVFCCFRGTPRNKWCGFLSVSLCNHKKGVPSKKTPVPCPPPKNVGVVHVHIPVCPKCQAQAHNQAGTGDLARASLIRAGLFSHATCFHLPFEHHDLCCCACGGVDR